MRILFSGVVAVAFAAGMLGCSGSAATVGAQAQTEQAPTFELDPSWPKQPLPNGWQFGYVMAVGLDQRNHAFVLHTVQEQYNSPGLVNESLQISKWFEREKMPGVVAAPPVVEFDENGTFVRGWGGNGHGYPWVAPGPEGMIAEHSLNVDPKGNVWITGGLHVALKFSPEGKFLLQIGKLWQSHGSADPNYLGDPSTVAFDAKANEVYIADGMFRNKRIIVFDMDTGAFKRMWAKGGKKPEDDSREPQTGMSTGWLHDVKVSSDGLVYGVGGRPVQTIQVMRTDGTPVREVPLPGKFSAVVLSTDPQQRYLYAAEMEEPDPYPSMFIYRRSDLTLLGSFKTPSGIERASHHFPGVDSKGNIYTTGNSMPQRFLLKTMPKK
jgi:hypothetical protein